VIDSSCVACLARDVALWKDVMNLLLAGLNLFNQSGYINIPRPNPIVNVM
jgi:hypothetical protein